MEEEAGVGTEELDGFWIPFEHHEVVLVGGGTEKKRKKKRKKEKRIMRWVGREGREKGEKGKETWVVRREIRVIVALEDY